MAKCNIIREGKEVVYTEAPNGERSQLYDSLKAKLQDSNEALRFWLASKTEKFLNTVTHPTLTKFRQGMLTTLNAIKPTDSKITLNIDGRPTRVDLKSLQFTNVKRIGFNTITAYVTPKDTPTAVMPKEGVSITISPENEAELIRINKYVFDLNDEKAIQAATVMDSMIGTMAKRAGITKSEMYSKIGFGKSSLEELKKYRLDNPLFQVDAVLEKAEAQSEEIELTRDENGAILAPNGKLSNLNETQAKIVRTKAFKAWFGDWENDPENSSKVVDENGEPLVVYHGSASKDIEVFNRDRRTRYSSGLRELGHYFATNKKVAEVYRKSPLTEEAEMERKNKLWQLAERQKEVRNIRDWDAIQAEMDELRKKGRIYPVFLNLRDFVTFDGKGEANIEAWNHLEVKASYKWATNRDAMDFLKDGRFGVPKVDGVKAENIADVSSFAENVDQYIGDVFLIFEGRENLIKLADGSNTTFDSNSPEIKMQSERGAMYSLDSKYIINALTDPNVSTPLHELAHVYENYLTKEERLEILKWTGQEAWTIESSEKFARGFEKYLAEGKAPTPELQSIFDNFKQWLLDIYNGIVGSDIDIELNDQMRAIYDSMLVGEQVSPESGAVSVTKSTSTNESFDSRFDLNIEGGHMDIGRVKGSGEYSIISLKVDAPFRRQGIATKLLTKALEVTGGKVAGSASNEMSVGLNYNLGMRAYNQEGKELSKAETIALVDKQGYATMRLPESTKKSLYKEASDKIDFAGVDMHVKESKPEVSRYGFRMGGKAYVPVDVMMNFLDVRGAKDSPDAYRNYQRPETREKIEALKKSFLEKGWEDQTQSTILLDVDVNGNAWIQEGNHRLIAAKELGMTHVPVSMELGAARSGSAAYDEYTSRSTYPIISREKIQEFNETAQRKDYHIKYVSIWETNLVNKKANDRARQNRVQDSIQQQGAIQGASIGKGSTSPQGLRLVEGRVETEGEVVYYQGSPHVVTNIDGPSITISDGESEITVDNSKLLVEVTPETDSNLGFSETETNPDNISNELLHDAVFTNFREKNLEPSDDEVIGTAAYVKYTMDGKMTAKEAINKAVDKFQKKGESPVKNHVNTNAKGSKVSTPNVTYNEAVRSNSTQKGDNLWVRNDSAESNEGRVLMVQFASTFLYGKDKFKRSLNSKYFDALYRKIPGYNRTSDFWEVPLWMASIAGMESKSDVYVVRNIEEAQEFLKEAKYDRVLFSALDVNEAHIEKLATNIPNQQFSIGGYTAFEGLSKLDNVDLFKSVESYADKYGVKNTGEYSYRHFKGTQTIPRLKMSEGCTYRCAFCSIPKKVIAVTDNEIMKAVDSMKDLDATLVYLDDKTFGQAKNHKMLPEIYKKLKEYNPGFEGFIIQTTSVDFADKKRFSNEYLKASGIKYVELGIETYNDDILTKLNKKHSHKRFTDAAVARVRENGLKLIPNIVVGLSWTENQNDTLIPVEVIEDPKAEYTALREEITELFRQEQAKEDAGERAFTPEYWAKDEQLRDRMNHIQALADGKVRLTDETASIEEQLNALNDPYQKEVGSEFFPRQSSVKRGEKISEESDLGGIFEVEADGYLFRGVSLEDYNRMKAQGYIDTDLRGAISEKEGINLAENARTAFNYLPQGEEGVVMAIKVTDKSGLFMIGADDYVRSSKPIPFSDVEFVTTEVFDARFAKVRDGKYKPITIRRTEDTVIKTETAESYENTYKFLEANSDIISHMNVYSLAIYEGTPLGDAIDVREESDKNENVITKSWQKNQQIHLDAMDKFSKFALDQVEGRMDETSAEQVNKAPIKVGRLRYKETSTEIVVDSSLLAPLMRQTEKGFADLKGLGLGKALYSELFKIGMQKGKKVVSSDNLSPASTGLWESMVSLGVASKVDGRYELNMNPKEFDSNGEPSMGQVINFVEQQGLSGTLSETEIVELKEDMIGIDVASSSELFVKLKGGFFTEGYFNPTRESLTKTNLYTSEEITDILTDEALQQRIKEYIYKLGSLDVEVMNDMYADDAYLVIHNGEKNGFGRFKLANPYAVEKIAIERLAGIKSREEFEDALMNDPELEALQEAYEESKYTNRDIFHKMSTFRQVAEVKVEDGKLTAKRSGTKERLENTLKQTVDPVLEDNIKSLLGLSADVMTQNPAEVVTILRDISKGLIEKGIDAVELPNVYGARPIAQTKAYLNAALKLIQVENEVTFNNFVEAHDAYFQTNTEYSYRQMQLGRNVPKDNVFHMEYYGPKIGLFARHSLIPVGRNAYKRVSTEQDLNGVYEFMYNHMMANEYPSVVPASVFQDSSFDEDGTLNLSKFLDPANKENVLADLDAYIREKAKEVYLGNENVNSEQAAMYVMIFNFYNRTPQVNKFDEVADMQKEHAVYATEINNEEYLKHEFVPDFNVKMLKEKAKNSKAYQDFYSQFDINEHGLFLKNTDPITLNKIKPYLAKNKDLVDYFKLKKQGFTLGVAATIEPILDDVFMRNFYVNYPTAAPAYKGSYRALNDTDVLAPSKEQFLLIDGSVYELVNALGKLGVYVKLDTNNTSFKEYDTNRDKPIVSADLRRVKIADTEVSTEINKKNLYSQSEGKKIDENHDNC